MAEGDNGAGRTLVLGGGGVAGIAWTTGLLAGLADAGQDVSGADLLIGTSAGSNVAAQLGSGLPLEDLYARQADPAGAPGPGDPGRRGPGAGRGRVRRNAVRGAGRA
jgi:predicted acylesterase/phospholipase RssA